MEITPDSQTVAMQELGGHLYEAREGIQALKSDIMELGDRLSSEIADVDERTNQRLTKLEHQIGTITEILEALLEHLQEDAR